MFWNKNKKINPSIVTPYEENLLVKLYKKHGKDELVEYVSNQLKEANLKIQELSKEIGEFKNNEKQSIFINAKVEVRKQELYVSLEKRLNSVEKTNLQIRTSNNVLLATNLDLRKEVEQLKQKLNEKSIKANKA